MVHLGDKRFTRMRTDCSSSARDFPGSLGFSRLSRNLPVFLGISRHFQVNPGAFESLRKGPAAV